MRRQAFINLIAAGTNALIDAGMCLRFEDVSDEQKNCLGQTKETGVTSVFYCDGVMSCAASKPSGCGEESIVVLYDSTEIEIAQRAAQTALYLLHDTSGITMAKATLERKTGQHVPTS